MTTRRPAIGFDLKSLLNRKIQDREEQLERFSILHGRALDMTFESGSAAARANHGLGRKFVGALIIGVTTNFSDTWWDEVCVMTPERATAAGYNPAEQVVVRRRFYGGAIGEVEFRVWVF